MSLTLQIPTVNDNLDDFDCLFQLWQQVNEDSLEVIFDFSKCWFLRPNAVAFLGGLIRLIKSQGRKVTFQEDTLQRIKVVEEVKTAWSQVTSMAACTEINIDEKTTNTSLKRFQTQLLDGYDLLILEAMNKANVKQIITDDGDYLTIPDIQVFTANYNVIATATKQGKLLDR